MSLVLLACCGPAAIEVSEINTLPRLVRPRPPEQVEFLASGPPSRSHVDIAILRAHVDTSTGVVDSYDAMLARLRVLAGQMGCDALTVTPNNPLDRDGVFAACVVYTDPAATR
jgi:hypothetical protein